MHLFMQLQDLRRAYKVSEYKTKDPQYLQCRRRRLRQTNIHHVLPVCGRTSKC